MSQQGPFLFEIRLEDEEHDSRQAYNVLYDKTTLSQIESFYRWLMRRLRLPPQGRLLDVSCGAGEVVRLAGQQGLRAVGVDISEAAARSARSHVAGQGAIAVSSGENLPFSDASFDYVTNIGSLEHFIDPAQGVREMARVMVPGGRAFVLVPNTFSLLTNVWEAFRHGRTAVDNQPIQRYGARADWEHLLQTNGLYVRRCIKYERPFPYHFPDWGYYLRHPKELARLATAPFVPLNLAFCFLFVCER